MAGYFHAGSRSNKSTRTPKVVPQLRRSFPWAPVTSDVKQLHILRLDLLNLINTMYL